MRIATLLLCSLWFATWVSSVSAQTGCTARPLGSLLALFSDNAGPATITPANVRDLICSVPSLVLGSGSGGGLNVIPPLVLKNTTAGARTVGGTYNMLVVDTSSTAIGSFASDFSNISNVLTQTAGSTVNNTNGFATYIHNRAVSSGIFGPNAVGVMSQAYSEVNGAQSWGINTIVGDAVGLTGVNLQNEFDVNITSASTKGFGLVVTGFSTAQGASMAAFVAAPPSLSTPGVVKWNTASFWSEEAAASTGILLGAANPAGVSVPSQTINMQYYDSAGIGHTVTSGILSTGQFSISTPLPGLASGFDVFNNVSNAIGTGAETILTTANGALTFLESQATASTASGTITETGSAGLSITGGSGGLFLTNVGTAAHSSNTVCLSIDTVTGLIKASSTVTTC